MTRKILGEDTLLTTKEIATLTGFSTSFFEKGRSYGYGPNFEKPCGSVRYWKSEVELWINGLDLKPTGN